MFNVFKAMLPRKSLALWHSCAFMSFQSTARRTRGLTSPSIRIISLILDADHFPHWALSTICAIFVVAQFRRALEFQVL